MLHNNFTRFKHIWIIGNDKYISSGNSFGFLKPKAISKEKIKTNNLKIVNILLRKHAISLFSRKYMRTNLYSFKKRAPA